MSFAILRAVVGAIFVAAALRAAAAFVALARDFAVWHVPIPAVALLAVLATTIVCGTLLALGALTRPVALLLATISVGLFAAGVRAENGIVVVAAPVLFSACVIFAWRSGRIAGTSPPRPPGVQ